MSEESSRIIMTIINKRGLHARASSKLVECANKFSSDIIIKKGDKSVNGKSVMEVMLLVANHGSQIEILANGVDKEMAINELSKLIENKFGEEE